jgi:NitT/TauT family transport system ATP-binding protein
MIAIERIAKTYVSKTQVVHALGDVTTRINEGEFVSIVGPSGCGKSTLLHLLAGFDEPSAGTIVIDGLPVRPGTVPRGLGYIFQKDTVLPWRSVRENIALGPRFHGVDRKTIARKVDTLLALGGLQGFGDMFPHQLSGGMRRRVALLMTLACDPSVLLLDEPFGALDTHTRTLLHRELIAIWRDMRQTVILVTHDLDEAVALSDRILVLSRPPSTFLLDHRVDIPHPRDVFSVRETPAFAHHFRAIWKVLGDQFREPAESTSRVMNMAVAP